MPKIPLATIDCVVFLYKSKAAAKSGVKFGGTGFLLTVPAAREGMSYYYVVSNWHVAVAGGYSVIRLNTKDGATEIFEFGPDEWTFSPGSHDVAVRAISVDIKKHRINAVPFELLATEQKLSEYRVGVGDDVFMIGRFVDHDQGPTNVPAARFGNISVMPMPMEQPTGAIKEAFCIDLHSRAGYSGSPVFVYRTPGMDLDLATGTKFYDWHSKGFILLLGVHYGQFPEEWELTSGKRGSKQYVKGMSGMTCVCPASSIIEILNMPKLAKPREEADKRLLARVQTNIPEAESNSDENDAIARDEILRAALNAPPSPRQTKAKQSKRAPGGVSSKSAASRRST